MSHLRFIPRYLAAMCLLLSFASISVADVEVCQQPPDASYLSVAHHDIAPSHLDRGNATVEQRVLTSEVQFQTSDRLALGIRHEYTILNAGQIEPQTNGHLHTISFPLHSSISQDHGSFRFSIAPSLSASSNAVSDPGSYNSNALQLLAAFVWSRQVSEEVVFRYGICGDHRFGSYAVYPSIGISWKPGSAWMVELGFPTSQVWYQISNSLTSSLRIAPAGNEWFVRDRALEKQSQLIYQSLLFEWVFDWKAHEHVSLSASVGRQINNRYEMTLLDDSRVRFDGDSVTRIGAAVVWRF